jgi:hypothetical protein
LKGYKVVGDNSTYLAEQFTKQQGTRANAFINYESWLLTLNASGKLREPLYLIYPHEGVATADYPFMLLNEAKRADYLKVVEYLKGDTAQMWLAKQTLRRPMKAELARQVENLLPARGFQVELPFSPDRELADGLIDAYLNEEPIPLIFDTGNTFPVLLDIQTAIKSGVSTLKGSHAKGSGIGGNVNITIARFNSLRMRNTRVLGPGISGVFLQSYQNTFAGIPVRDIPLNLLGLPIRRLHRAFAGFHAVHIYVLDGKKVDIRMFYVH